MEKNILRKTVKLKRCNYNTKKIEAASKKISACILRLKEYIEADVVYMYMPLNNEVDVSSLFDESLKRNKKVVIPRVLDDKRMEFYQVESINQLEEGYMGILEPDKSIPVYKKDENEKSIMIVPGVVFDRAGGRIGMGKGFYDRYIEANNIDVLCGVCMNFQLLKDECIEMEEFDKYLDIVVTEFEIIYN